MALMEDIARSVLEGDDARARELVEQALHDGHAAQDVLKQGLLVGMGEVGRLFRDGEYFLPEVLVSADAMKRGMAVLEPHLLSSGAEARAVAVVGTVQGDLHDIGKNLAATMLQGAGFEVVDLGVDVPPEKFVAACQERSVHLVGLSALLTTTMPQMIATVKQLRETLGDSPKIIVGGAPVTEKFAEEIGADGYGADAASGAEVAKQMCLGDVA